MANPINPILGVCKDIGKYLNKYQVGETGVRIRTVASKTMSKVTDSAIGWFETASAGAKNR